MVRALNGRGCFFWPFCQKEIEEDFDLKPFGA